MWPADCYYVKLGIPKSEQQQVRDEIIIVSAIGHPL